MKRMCLLYILIMAFSTFSCEGDFKPFEADGEVRLLFPENKKVCPEGEVISTSKIQIPLRWSSDIMFSSYTIDVTDKDGNSVGSLSSEDLETRIDVNRGELYNWKVTGIRGGEKIESESWSFYSEGNATSNHAPYPAAISHSESNGSATLSWIAFDEDNDIENYDVFLSTTSPPTMILLENTTETQSTNELMSGIRYYVKVVAFDVAGNYSIATYDFIL